MKTHRALTFLLFAVMPLAAHASTAWVLDVGPKGAELQIAGSPFKLVAQFPDVGKTGIRKGYITGFEFVCIEDTGKDRCDFSQAYRIRVNGQVGDVVLWLVPPIGQSTTQFQMDPIGPTAVFRGRMGEYDITLALHTDDPAAAEKMTKASQGKPMDVQFYAEDPHHITLAGVPFTIAAINLKERRE